MSILLGGILVLNIAFSASAYGLATLVRLQNFQEKVHADFGRVFVVTAIVAVVIGCIGSVAV